MWKCSQLIQLNIPEPLPDLLLAVDGVLLQEGDVLPGQGEAGQNL